MPRRKCKRCLDLEDIVSQYLADMEMKYRQALEEDRFYSVHLINRCRKIFNLTPLPTLKGKKNKKAIQ